jgi:hypothetical protein
MAQSRYNFGDGDRGDDYEELAGREETSTDKAILIEFANSGTLEWCPRSQIGKISEPDSQGCRLYQIKSWWCRKAGVV